jgi:hypothetical protein
LRQRHRRPTSTDARIQNMIHVYHRFQLFLYLCICPSGYAVGGIEGPPNIILQSRCPLVGIFPLALGRPAIVSDMFVELVVRIKVLSALETDDVPPSL